MLRRRQCWRGRLIERHAICIPTPSQQFIHLPILFNPREAKALVEWGELAITTHGSATTDAHVLGGLAEAAAIRGNCGVSNRNTFFPSSVTTNGHIC